MQLSPGLYIGTSGWSYKEDWKDVFYHSLSSMLQQYATYFDTAEINSTFYSLPSTKMVQYLSDNLPPKKFFTAKLPRDVTHDNRLNLSGEGGAVLREFYGLMRPLQHRLAALLIQLPPWDITSMSDLESFFSGLDHSFRYAIEFRHESWTNQKTWKLLEDYHIAHCIVDEPLLPIDLRVTTDFSYIRWHGRGTAIWYDYRYSKEELEEWVPRIQGLKGQTDTVLGYFNNHFSGFAPFNALELLQLLDMITPRQQQKLKRMGTALSHRQTSLDGF